MAALGLSASTRWLASEGSGASRDTRLKSRGSASASEAALDNPPAAGLSDEMAEENSRGSSGSIRPPSSSEANSEEALTSRLRSNSYPS